MSKHKLRARRHGAPPMGSSHWEPERKSVGERRRQQHEIGIGIGTQNQNTYVTGNM